MDREKMSGVSLTAGRKAECAECWMDDVAESPEQPHGSLETISENFTSSPQNIQAEERLQWV